MAINKNKALINYYASIVRKNNYKIENVPEELRDAVNKRIEELGPRKPDPVTETPEEK